MNAWSMLKISSIHHPVPQGSRAAIDYLCLVLIICECVQKSGQSRWIYLCVFDPLPPDSNPPCSAVHQSVRPEDKWLPVMGVVASWPVERISWCLLLWGHLSVTDRHRCIFIDALTSYFCLHAFIQSLCIFKDSQLHFRSVSSLRNSSQWVTTKTFM